MSVRGGCPVSCLCVEEAGSCVCFVYIGWHFWGQRLVWDLRSKENSKELGAVLSLAPKPLPSLLLLSIFQSLILFSVAFHVFSCI